MKLLDSFWTQLQENGQMGFSGLLTACVKLKVSNFENRQTYMLVSCLHYLSHQFITPQITVTNYNKKYGMKNTQNKTSQVLSLFDSDQCILSMEALLN
jgi:hypothetical protein